MERFFQFALLGLVTSGFFALIGSGGLDRVTLTITGVALLLRGLSVSGFFRFTTPQRALTVAAFACIGFFAFELFTGRGLVLSTTHAVCFLSAIKIVTAQSNRDYIYTGAIAFVELIAAAILSINASFFLYLALYIVFSIAAFTSAEIRRGFQRHEQSVPPESARVTWRLGLVAVASTIGILIITAGLFLLVPRTARAAAMLFPNAPHLTGFANEINLGSFGEIGNDDRPVMHIQPYTKNLPPNLKWRGAAWSHFDGKRWSDPLVAGQEVPSAALGFAAVADDWQRSRRDGKRVIYRVDVRNADAGVLFIAGIPEFINVNARKLFRTPENSFRIISTQGDSLRYEVSAQIAPPLPRPLQGQERSRYLRLPPLSIRIWTQAREWAGEGSPMERAERIQSHLRNDFTYELRLPATPAADPLSDFLFVRRKGHCEYFASAMAVMLRTIGIPSRMASGFQSGYLNDVSGQYVVRGSDAHAWVEGYIDGVGWVTFDPTPASRNVPRTYGVVDRMNTYLDALDNSWQEWVMSYDLGHQITLAARLEEGFRHLTKDLTTGWTSPNPNWRNHVIAGARFWIEWALGLALAVVFGVFAGPRIWREVRGYFLLRKVGRQNDSRHDASLLYRRLLEILAQKGLQKPPFFTPAEFASHLPPEHSVKVVQFTHLYNAARFGNADATAQLSRLLTEISNV